MSLKTGETDARKDDSSRSLTSEIVNPNYSQYTTLILKYARALLPKVDNYGDEANETTKSLSRYMLILEKIPYQAGSN